MSDKLINVIDVAYASEAEDAGSMVRDVVDIGLAVVNVKRCEIEDGARWLVKPSGRIIIKPEWAEKINITTMLLDSAGVPAKRAMAELLWPYSVRSRPLAAFGQRPRLSLDRLSCQAELGTCAGSAFIDVRAMAALVMGHPDKAATLVLEEGMRYFKVPRSGRHASADEKVRNVAMLLCRLIEAARGGRENEHGSGSHVPRVASGGRKAAATARQPVKEQQRRR